MELLIVMSLLAVFLGTVYETVIAGLRTVNATDERAGLRQQLTHALGLLTREASLASRVDTADSQQLQFDADLDGNGTTEHNINYQISGSALQRVYSGAAMTLVDRITAFSVSYVDAAGATLTTPVNAQATRDTIRVAQITITATNDAEALSMTSAAYLRNN